ncbi:hypothetical protein ACOSQ2_016923 [Xanthoceras sorbifolium]
MLVCTIWVYMVVNIESCCRGTLPLQRGLMGSLNIKKSPLIKRGAGTPLLTFPKKTRLEKSTQKSQPLLLEGSASNLSPPSPAIAGGARGRGKEVNFDASTERPVQRGMSGPSTAVGQVAFPSSSQVLGVVAKEYLEWALMLYEEFLIGSLSQRIEKDEGPDLRHILITSSCATMNSNLF